MLITILFVVALIFSAIIHEYAHGWVAYKLGDHTAEDAGRLTLNPLAHLDPIGSVLVPLLLVLSKTGFFIAWAKPVPYNPYNLRDPKYGDLKVALGGPGSNLLLAIFMGLFARVLPLATDLKLTLAQSVLFSDGDAALSLIHGNPLAAMYLLAGVICFVNLALMLFNLIPIPPLDGSKILLPFLSHRNQMRFHQLSNYGFMLIFILAYLGAFNLIIIPLVYGFSFLMGA
ncbi:site-2 protease family protein [Candidatus Falkowbacteria bacterium]|nr:site-2 protease family protein [Candidatus Falkowbacteria bacterium]